MADEVDFRMAAGAAVAREAGMLARDYFLRRESLDISLKGHQDYVTEADIAVERLIVERLGALFPDDTFLGEEGGGEPGERVWVIDPIDGTANFTRGEPHFAVSIAYVQAGSLELGFIHEPMAGALYAARRGRGAACDGKTLKASATDDLTRARVELSYSRSLGMAAYCDLLLRADAAGCAVRQAGSATLGLARVADGRSDAWYAQAINSWDVLAGLLLVAEAGGVTNDFLADGDLRARKQVFVAAPGVAAGLAQRLGVG